MQNFIQTKKFDILKLKKTLNVPKNANAGHYLKPTDFDSSF